MVLGAALVAAGLFLLALVADLRAGPVHLAVAHA